MADFIPYGRQSVTEADIAAVVDVLKSDFLTQGPVVPAFEDAVRSAVGARHAVAANSATSALHVACMALGVGPGDSVWTSPLTFVASSNAALYCGADVDFVDVDERSYNMCPVRLTDKLEAAAASGELPKVIIPVHLTGQSCDMAAIHAAASRYGVKIIEDASHAIGGRFGPDPVGSCRYSDIAVFSFHPVKIVTTGEGGMALTNDDELARLMRLDRSHGITRDAEMMHADDPGAWYYEQQRLGYNYRMTDINAALGFSQMGRLAEFIERRREIAQTYDAAFAAHPIQTPWQHPETASAWHLYVVRVAGRRAVFDALRDAGIGVNLHYIPVYLQPYYRDLGFEPGYCPNAERYYSEAISLPMFPSMTAEQQQRVIAEVTQAVAAAAAA
ncbi:UDP-4-amino-4,6-dideoxy-N-acetyl-beta-L-altrosamine transaminase [Erythrobacter rubeus]|uniref:UDP-4-amino-4, 6-dideoxy-N-acetyl-beta-L-altrosamine transaminase n=1 Tax=Erythrobacter rubeus TaxID=2760803 RepID=A0ABR8KW51_9SPHN|nr:UDP-4-amino-4,6-dideoxy-N-acetyl-beta-L-altrosamine transaminase [Erythrobacter rubeus]MBD2842457.1 UDP-4-amino-4,6-dideoxy-N-acetyl-beta-L-altrosamine transaminase [Erythrobacter rubeus]